MGKRRTRKQKIITNLRNQLTMVQTQIPKEEPVVVKPVLPPTYTHEYQPVTTARPLAKTISYDFVKKDLRKTAILFSSIMAIELLLFFLLKTNLVSVPFLNSY